MSAETALQTALYEALTALGLTVVDFAPQAADGALTGPYVEVGSVVMTEFDDFTQIGHNAVARIHVRAKSANAKVVKDIQGEIRHRLHRGNLIIEGHTLVLMQRETTDVMRSPNGDLHGVCEYRIKFTAN
jgi:hypothetical protein